MIVACFGLWIAASSATAALGTSLPSPPQTLDSRLVFERIAAEPEIVTPTGIAVDQSGRILVVESHTHFRPAGYQGPPADRIRVFEDRDRDGKTECTGTFFEGTQKTMNVAVVRDGSVFVATRSALHRLEDRDGDGRSDGTGGGTLPTPIIQLDTKGDYPHNGLSGFAFDRPVGIAAAPDGTLYISDWVDKSYNVHGKGRIWRLRNALFEATLAALEQLDGKMRNPRDEVAGEEYIVALLTDPRTSASVLERGLRMLRPTHPALTLDRLRRFVTGHDAGVAIEAARTLSQSSSPARFAVLSKLALDRNASPALRAEAIVGLADDGVNRARLC
jgi:hypothetical protein